MYIPYLSSSNTKLSMWNTPLHIYPSYYIEINMSNCLELFIFLFQKKEKRKDYVKPLIMIFFSSNSLSTYPTQSDAKRKSPH